MRTRILAPVVVALVAALACGCSTDPGAPASTITSPGEDHDPNIVIRLDVAETLPDRMVRVFARTEEQYPCSNYGIRSEVGYDGSAFEIDFSAIVSPDVCLTAPSYATTALDLGTLHPGRHPVSIRGIAGRAVLEVEVTREGYRILGRPGPRIRLEQTALRRIPDGLVWGYFDYASRHLDSDIDATIAAMVTLGGRPIQLAPGAYHATPFDKFRVLEDGSIHNPEPGVPFRRPFALDYTGDLNALRDLVHGLRPRVQDGLYLRVITWRGEWYLSWYQPPG